MMNRQVLMAAGIAGMLLGAPHGNALADVNVMIGIRDRPGPRVMVNTWPSFIFVPRLGFSVAVDSPYNILFYDNYYYFYQDGSWFRSTGHRGPWIVVERHRIPRPFRTYRMGEIHRYRDIEYRRHDRNRRWDDRRWNDRRWDDRDRRDDRRWNDRDRDGRFDNDNRCPR